MYVYSMWCQRSDEVGEREEIVMMDEEIRRCKDTVERCDDIIVAFYHLR